MKRRNIFDIIFIREKNLSQFISSTDFVIVQIYIFWLNDYLEISRFIGLLRHSFLAWGDGSIKKVFDDQV